jgi:hypothetical protein
MSSFTKRENHPLDIGHTVGQPLNGKEIRDLGDGKSHGSIL